MDALDLARHRGICFLDLAGLLLDHDRADESIPEGLRQLREDGTIEAGTAEAPGAQASGAGGFVFEGVDHRFMGAGLSETVGHSKPEISREIFVVVGHTATSL